MTAQPTAAQLKLAAQVNVKYRKWISAKDKVFGSFNDPSRINKSVRLLNELGAFIRANDVEDFNDGETFGIPLEDGTILHFARTSKGDPRFMGVVDYR